MDQMPYLHGRDEIRITSMKNRSSLDAKTTVVIWLAPENVTRFHFLAPLRAIHVIYFLVTSVSTFTGSANKTKNIQHYPFHFYDYLNYCYLDLFYLHINCFLKKISAFV